MEKETGNISRTVNSACRLHLAVTVSIMPWVCYLLFQRMSIAPLWDYRRKVGLLSLIIPTVRLNWFSPSSHTFICSKCRTICIIVLWSRRFLPLFPSILPSAHQSELACFANPYWSLINSKLGRFQRSTHLDRKSMLYWLPTNLILCMERRIIFVIMLILSSNNFRRFLRNYYINK